jgi:hypothetical protein
MNRERICGRGVLLTAPQICFSNRRVKEGAAS